MDGQELRRLELKSLMLREDLRVAQTRAQSFNSQISAEKQCLHQKSKSFAVVKERLIATNQVELPIAVVHDRAINLGKKLVASAADVKASEGRLKTLSTELQKALAVVSKEKTRLETVEGLLSKGKARRLQRKEEAIAEEIGDLATVSENSKISEKKELLSYKEDDVSKISSNQNAESTREDLQTTPLVLDRSASSSSPLSANESISGNATLILPFDPQRGQGNNHYQASHDLPSRSESHSSEGNGYSSWRDAINDLHGSVDQCQGLSDGNGGAALKLNYTTQAGKQITLQVESDASGSIGVTVAPVLERDRHSIAGKAKELKETLEANGFKVDRMRFEKGKSWV